MTLTRTAKAARVQNLAEKWTKAKSILFTHYMGLTVGDISQLRRELKEHHAEMTVAKKTLLRLAAEKAHAPCPDEAALPGPVACIFNFADPLTGAQIALAFSKVHPLVALIGGIFEGKILTKEEAIALANIPSHTTLLALFANMLRAPLQTFASLCHSPLQQFAFATGELAKKGNAPPSQL